MAQLVIIADDLTGAADTSACFADAGFSTVIPLFGAAHPDADVVALTTESRELGSDEAAQAVTTALATFGNGEVDNRPRWVYKKIDSALRGHPLVELLAVMHAASASRTIVAPALPAEGRTTIAARQHIGGVPLEESTLGTPCQTSDLMTIFANDRGLPVRHLALESIRGGGAKAVGAFIAGDDSGIIVADAENDSDLQAIASAVAPSTLRVLCGAAGFARQLALLLPMSSETPRPVATRPSDKPILVVAGSQHAATAKQIATLEQAGIPVIRLDQSHIDDPSAPMDDIISNVAALLAAGRATVVTTVGLTRSATGERSVAARLAEVVAAKRVQTRIGGLVLTGGDVAAAVCSALGATALWLGGEIYAGQPWGLLDGGALPGLPVATKAGSFGGEHALMACIEHLEHIKAT